VIYWSVSDEVAFDKAKFGSRKQLPAVFIRLFNEEVLLM